MRREKKKMIEDATEGRAPSPPNAGYQRLYVLLLVSFSWEFRQAYGDAMACVFEENLAEARARSGRFGVFSVLIYSVVDLAKAALTERLSNFAAARGIERQASLGASFAIHGILLSGLIWVGLHTVHPIHNSCDAQKIARPSALHE